MLLSADLAPARNTCSEGTFCRAKRSSSAAGPGPGACVACVAALWLPPVVPCDARLCCLLGCFVDVAPLPLAAEGG